MHEWSVSEREYSRHDRRRGRRHAYGPIKADQTALVVVDMVRFFVTDGSMALAVASRINESADRLRTAGGLVAWIVPTTSRATVWQREFFGESVASEYAASGGGGAPVERVADVMHVHADDVVTEKSAPSAFFPGRCDLDQHLRLRGVRRVLIAGTVTSVCCESTARDAATLGYQTLLLADCTADVSDHAHNASLRTLYRSFADVRSADDALRLAGC